jgi:endonuclease YncB( thermonuclease family)
MGIPVDGTIRQLQRTRVLPGRPPLFAPLPFAWPILLAAALIAGWFVMKEKPAQTGRAAATSFALCATPPHLNCVMDGDTFYLGREAIRVADIDAPETHPPRCTYEAQLGSRATLRLRELLNARPFDVKSYERDTDRYGRKLRIIARDGQSIGNMLVTEGLARPWTGKRAPWCG